MTALATYSSTSFRTTGRPAGRMAGHAAGHREGRPAGVLVRSGSTVRAGAARPAPQIYIRRRLLVAVIALAIVLDRKSTRLNSSH